MSDPLSPEEAAALEQALAPLRTAFRGKLAGRLAELEAAAAAARAGEGEALGELHQRAHSLKGTAGSYGFDAVSAAAGRIEELTGNAPDGREPRDLEAALGLLRRAVAEA